MDDQTLEERLSALELRLTRVHSDLNVMSAEVALAQLQKSNAQNDARSARRAIQACSRDLAAIGDQLPAEQAETQERIQALVERLDRVVRQG